MRMRVGSRRRISASLAAARELGVELPVTATVHQLLARVEAQGGGALGTRAIVTARE